MTGAITLGEIVNQPNNEHLRPITRPLDRRKQRELRIFWEEREKGFAQGELRKTFIKRITIKLGICRSKAYELEAKMNDIQYLRQNGIEG